MPTYGIKNILANTKCWLYMEVVFGSYVTLPTLFACFLSLDIPTSFFIFVFYYSCNNINTCTCSIINIASTLMHNATHKQRR